MSENNLEFHQPKNNKSEEEPLSQLDLSFLETITSLDKAKADLKKLEEANEHALRDGFGDLPQEILETARENVKSLEELAERLKKLREQYE